MPCPTPTLVARAKLRHLYNDEVDQDGLEITLLDEWIGQVTHFAVPGFLACSGFLFASSSASQSFSAVRWRLERILLPYLVFSAIAWCHTSAWASLGHEVDTTPFPTKLALFCTMGHYYYVFLISFFVCITPMIARMPDRLFPWVLAAAMTLQLALEIHLVPMPSLFWHIRNPMRLLAPFLLGWQVCRRHVLLRQWISGSWRFLWLLALLLLNYFCGIGLVVLEFWGDARLIVGWAMTYATLALLLVSVLDRPTAPWAVIWLSNASYPLYLSHYFFMAPVFAGWPQSGSFDAARIVVAWAAGLGGGVTFVVLSRHAMGEKLARKWLG
mmetsp:Transcript_86573/g.279474  ORF Transcript_86573/g.279474 Transcript_86573/m.279474 type:complete len:327 (-) Transcript_86573:102-1082(-)